MMRITIRDKSGAKTEVYDNFPGEGVCYRVSTRLWHPKQPPTELERKRNAFTSKSREYFTQLVLRDGGFCVKCGSVQQLTVDHIVPLARGGGNELDNLQILCKSCNSSKRDR